MMYCTSLDEVSISNNAARKYQTKQIAQHINIINYGTVADPANYKVPYNFKAGNKSDVKVDDSRAKRLKE
jgi:hypothetical protein